MKVLGYILVVYGAILVFSGLVKSSIMMKLARMKFGKNMSDRAIIRLLYIFGALVFVAGIVLLILY